MVEIDLDKCIEDIQEFFLMDDKHHFKELDEYMCYRANQITMIIENNCYITVKKLQLHITEGE